MSQQIDGSKGTRGAMNGSENMDCMPMGSGAISEDEDNLATPNIPGEGLLTRLSQKKQMKTVGVIACAPPFSSLGYCLIIW